jgi:hypothetical protein
MLFMSDTAILNGLKNFGLNEIQKHGSVTGSKVDQYIATFGFMWTFSSIFVRTI